MTIPQQKGQSMKNVIVWGLVSGILAGCNLTQTATPPDAGQSNIIVTSPASQATSAPLEPLVGQTYIDEPVGFSFTYPEGWTILANEADNDAVMYAITLASYDLSDVSRGGGIPTGETKVDVYVDRSEPKTLDDAYNLIQRNVDEGMVRIIEQEDMTLQSSMPAIYSHVVGMLGGEAHSYYFIINDYLVSISGFGDAGIIRQIADSVQPSS